jgi:hypothetical protein
MTIIGGPQRDVFYLIDKSEGDWHWVELWEDWGAGNKDQLVWLAKSNVSTTKAYNQMAEKFAKLDTASL